MATNPDIAERKITSVNPATGEELQTFACTKESELQDAVSRSRNAQTDWNGLGIRKRIDILRQFQHLLQQNMTAIAQAITREAGKPYVEALLTEVMVVLDATRFLVDNSYSFLRDEAVPHGNLAMKTKRGSLLREPYGVVGIIFLLELPLFDPCN